MKTYSTVIYTDHALTKTTENDFEICEVKADCVRRLGDASSALSFRHAVVAHTIVAFLARAGRIYDKGFWLVSMQPVGLKVKFTCTPLEIE